MWKNKISKCEGMIFWRQFVKVRKPIERSLLRRYKAEGRYRVNMYADAVSDLRPWFVLVLFQWSSFRLNHQWYSYYSHTSTVQEQSFPHVVKSSPLLLSWILMTVKSITLTVSSQDTLRILNYLLHVAVPSCDIPWYKCWRSTTQQSLPKIETWIRL